jgi:hypothetical protein
MRTDDMVREALADLAPTAPADNTALAGVHRAIGRRRRRRHVAQAVAAVALAATAVGTGALLLRAEDNKVQTGNSGDGRPTTTEPTTETTGVPKPDTTGRVTFGSVSFVVPDGWEAGPRRKLTDGESGAQGESMCIAPIGVTEPMWDDCPGLIVHQGDFLPGQEMFAYTKDTAGAWSHSTDVVQCPFVPGPPEGPVDNWVDTNREPIDGGLRPVGDHNADYNRWPASCPSGETFEPQAWYLPQSKVLIFDIFGHAETEEFLASFEFDE